MFLPGGRGGILLSSLLASSKLWGTTIKRFLDRGIPPPPVIEIVLLLRPLRSDGSGSSTESGVRGESCVAIESSLEKNRLVADEGRLKIVGNCPD